MIHALKIMDSTEDFWQLAGVTKTAEKYKIDKNLQQLEVAPLETLKKIFVQYRFFTHYYITDLAILISKLPFGKLRSILAEILYEELGNGNSKNSHPEIYDNFLLSIGIPKHELGFANLSCQQILTDIQSSLLSKPWSYGIGLRGMGGECLCQIYLAAMYEHFSKNTAILEIQHKIAWEFWEIHIGETDLHHQELMRDAINDLVFTQPETTNELIAGYLESKTAWNNYWEHIFKSARK